MTALEWALALAAEGLPCVPLGRGKRPLVKGGFNAATTDAGELRDLWRRFPDALVGVATGSRSGIAVLDIDPRHGGDAWLARNRARLPRTRTHQTRSGGVHLLFQHSPGLRCSTDRPARGIDVRGDGGGIAWWPAAGLPVLDDAPPAPWPAWLPDLVRPPPKPAPRPAPLPRDLDRYARGALISAAQRVADAPEGQRNAVLNAEGFSLATRFLRAGLLSEAVVRGVLTAAAANAGLPAQEIARTLGSAIGAGMAHG